MEIYLFGVPTIVIMCIDQWSSKSVLEYIQEQFDSVTFGVSKKNDKIWNTFILLVQSSAKIKILKVFL